MYQEDLCICTTLIPWPVTPSVIFFLWSVAFFLYLVSKAGFSLVRLVWLSIKHLSSFTFSTLPFYQRFPFPFRFIVDSMPLQTSVTLWEAVAPTNLPPILYFEISKTPAMLFWNNSRRELFFLSFFNRILLNYRGLFLLPSFVRMFTNYLFHLFISWYSAILVMLFVRVNN